MCTFSSLFVFTPTPHPANQTSQQPLGLMEIFETRRIDNTQEFKITLVYLRIAQRSPGMFLQLWIGWMVAVMPGVAVSTRQLCSCSPLLLQHSEDQTLLPPPPPPLRWFPSIPPGAWAPYIPEIHKLSTFLGFLLLFRLLPSGGSPSEPHPYIFRIHVLSKLWVRPSFLLSSEKKVFWDMSSYRRKFIRCHHRCTCKGWFPGGFPSCITIQSPMTDVLFKGS